MSYVIICFHIVYHMYMMSVGLDVTQVTDVSDFRLTLTLLWFIL